MRARACVCAGTSFLIQGLLPGNKFCKIFSENEDHGNETKKSRQSQNESATSTLKEALKWLFSQVLLCYQLNGIFLWRRRMTKLVIHAFGEMKHHSQNESKVTLPV